MTDAEKALLWKQAESGSVEAQHKLGQLYANGEEVDQDYEKARHWWQKAADQGYAEAQRHLKETGRHRGNQHPPRLGPRLQVNQQVPAPL